MVAAVWTGALIVQKIHRSFGVRFYATIAVLIVCFFLFGLLALIGLHSEGLCLEQRRFVSSDEMIDAAVGYELSHLARIKTFEDESLKQNELLKSFLGVDEFKASNPKCCTLAGNSDNDLIYGWFARITGKAVNAVRLEYEIKFKNFEGQTKSIIHKQDIPVSSCAKIEVEVFRNPIGRPFQ
jgi:hypothetical protein